MAAEEHKEHPGSTHEAEHPGKTSEHPPHGVTPGEKAGASAEKVIKAIKEHIAGITAANGGVFPIRDEAEGKDLRLNLIKVHEDKVSRIKKDDAYFACTDFITEDGAAKYDLDFWMKEGAGGALEVYMTKIHKKDGNPRFTYMEDEIVEVK